MFILCLLHLTKGFENNNIRTKYLKLMACLFILKSPLTLHEARNIHNLTPEGQLGLVGAIIIIQTFSWLLLVSHAVGVEIYF